MKHNISIIAMVVLVAFTSCKKFLDTKPSSFLAPDQYYTGATLTNALAGVYNSLSVYGQDYAKGLFTCNDETFWGGPGRNTPDAQSSFSFDYANSNVSNLWSKLYTGIERANQLIAYVDKNDPSAEVQAAYGEALFLRGYYHFLLVSNFGAVPLKLTPSTDPNNLSLSRTPVDSIYQSILSDMKMAEGKVYPISKLGTASRVSKTAVQGILARVYLTMAGYPFNGGKAGSRAMYDSSSVYSQKVINSGLHSLNPSYSQVFINHAADKYEVKESIWEADFSGSDANPARLTGGLGSQNGIRFTAENTYAGSATTIWQDSGYSYAYIYVTQKLYDLYDKSDTRRDWNIQNFNYGVNTSRSPIVSRDPISNTTPFAYNRNNAKWRRNYEVVFPKSKNNTAINFPILRFADVLLMFAEADLQLNGGTCSAEGIAAVNAVRERGFGLAETTAPLKSLTITNQGSGYNTTLTSGYNNASLGNINQGNNLGYASTITGGKVTAVNLTSGGLGFTPTSATTIYLGNAWAANITYSVNQQVINNGNLYTITTAGTSTSTPPTQTSGASIAATTGAVFTYAGPAATATGTLLTKADVDLMAVTLQNIQDERSRELCYEGLRTRDLIRWNIFVPTMTSIANQVNSWTTFSSNTKAQVIAGYNNVASAAPYKFLLLPIPASEITVNKNMTQNPGW
ncbi:RagB/SusD family nutrient uptake outer membrane protein [Chitinophagaceae bacterium LB-8]|uniref:RagB/SusD family nutrient uptake outer membrane protein n=1 Tax=Paraflavisolibacter caeni TaxID=2982496 RepID=A0A9X3B866_9BACT|nr:RagB/SusD family nutrient uptake outer membrane protein [Paraflavisolibacter caeni]MCU7549246.1 RagB/SusD family nutrient uptake outer membrane protein [Paraflavisolibacter caeni]